MSAIQALRLAQEKGVRIGVAGTDLILEADQEPAPKVLEGLRRHKAGIVALLRATDGDWTAKDWQTFFDERAGIAEFDQGHTRAEAEAVAFECCVVEWLNRYPELSDPGRCAWCGKPEAGGSVVVPFGTTDHGHTWLHHDCWNDWSRNRRKKAKQALAEIGLEAPPKCAKGQKADHECCAIDRQFTRHNEPTERDLTTQAMKDTTMTELRDKKLTELVEYIQNGPNCEVEKSIIKHWKAGMSFSELRRLVFRDLPWATSDYWNEAVNCLWDLFDFQESPPATVASDDDAPF